MKLRNYIILSAIALFAFACTSDKTENEPFSPEPISLSFGPEGGVETRRIPSDARWIASTDNTWIVVSPANGRGTTECQFIIDSTLVNNTRTGVVRIQNLDTWEEKEIRITQEGFPYSIEVESKEVEIENYKNYGERYFDVKVRSNVDFKVKNDYGWVSNESYKINLNRGVRPREVSLRFNWDINTSDKERIAEIMFEPTEQIELARQDKLCIRQNAADPIIPDTRAGDSVAMLCISRALQTLSPIDASKSMNEWNSVTLWAEGMKGWTKEKNGRVKKASFALMNTKEPLPYEVRYLTAADEIYIFGNTNTFMLNLELGEDICELKQLRRLTVGAYGLISLPQSLTKLENLEYLDICANNFQRVPEILTKENFPKLRTLIMNANQRSVVYDLSNTTRTDLGGFYDEPEFPAHLIKWNLDTLVISVNYLQGSLPDFLDDPEVECYTQEDIKNSRDTLPQFLVDNKIRKVMTKTKHFAINYNRMTGKLPDWVLYHPALDIWLPYSFVFTQEGRAKNGKQAGFDNEPPSLSYYYNLYTKKQQPTGEEGVE